MVEITEVIASDTYLVTVRFANNHSADIDMKNRSYTVHFSELRN